LRAASAIALSKQADQPAANSCSGLLPIRAEPGVESLSRGGRQSCARRHFPVHRWCGFWPCTLPFRFGSWCIPRFFFKCSCASYGRSDHWPTNLPLASTAQLAATSTTAWAEACGASRGRLCCGPSVFLHPLSVTSMPF
jgi:hypothetical protein